LVSTCAGLCIIRETQLTVGRVGEELSRLLRPCFGLAVTSGTSVT